MPTLRKVIEFLFPEMILEGKPWLSTWNDDQRRLFANRNRIFFTLCAVAYVAHYYFIDVPNQKEPIEAWFAFRMTMVALCLVCIGFYSSKLSQTSYYMWPAVTAMAIGSFSQAYVTVYFPEAPWIYPYIFVFSSVLVLGTSPLKSIAFSLPIMISFISPLTGAGIPLYQLVSATAVCAIVISVVRTAYISEIRNFVLTQERDESRSDVIRLAKEYENRLKSFIPRVIADRIQLLLDETKKSAIEATVDVLNPVKQDVACLWSDIRGFTQESSNIEDFLLDSVIPEVKVCSDEVERFHGIPRKIGDLIFAYFDAPNEKLNLVRALLAGFALSERNKDMNATVSSINIKRYILVSSGEAIVGNVGGLNSGVEITALGPPVNFLARLDDATKQPGLSRHLEPGDLILCERSGSILMELGLEIDLCEISITDAGILIRDFPDVDRVYVLRPSHGNQEVLAKVYENLSQKKK